MKKILLLVMAFSINMAFAAQVQEFPKFATAQDLTLMQKKAQESITPLMEAANAGDINKVQGLLVNTKININAQDIYGRTALIYAINANQPKVVQLLMNSNGLDVNIKDHVGWTALMYAIEKNNKDIVKMLLDGCDLPAGNLKLCSDVNVADKIGITPLIMALEIEDESLVKALVAKGADTKNLTLKIRGADGKLKLISALDFVLSKRLINLIKYFTPDTVTPLMLATEKGDLELFHSLLKRYPDDIFAKDLNGRTALHYAAQFNQPQIIKELFQIYSQLNMSPAVVDVVDNDGLTPLALAVEFASFEAVPELLQKGN